MHNDGVHWHYGFRRGGGIDTAIFEKRIYVMERVISSLAIANPRLSAEDYVGFLEQVGVTVEPGARTILSGMPDSHNLPKRFQCVEARRGPSDGMRLAEIARTVAEQFGCGTIEPHLVPVACTEIVRHWQGVPGYGHIVLFHKPVDVLGALSVLHFRRVPGGIVLGHTDAGGSWEEPDSLFACSQAVEESA